MDFVDWGRLGVCVLTFPLCYIHSIKFFPGHVPSTQASPTAQCAHAAPDGQRHNISRPSSTMHSHPLAIGSALLAWRILQSLHGTAPEALSRLHEASWSLTGIYGALLLP